MVELVPDAHTELTRVYALDAHGALVGIRVAGTSREGFDAEWSATHLSIVRGGMLARSEWYSDDQLDEALARFEELAPHAT